VEISEAIDRIDARWVRKPKGFRVQFDIYTDGRWRTDYSPEQSDPPLNSAVMAWRFAWKLAQTCEVGKAPYEDGDIANIFVIDIRVSTFDLILQVTMMFTFLRRAPVKINDEIRDVGLKKATEKALYKRFEHYRSLR